MLTAENWKRSSHSKTNLHASTRLTGCQTAEIESALKKVAELQATIATQLQTITELSAKASVNQKIEHNGELHNRSENMKEAKWAP